MKQIKSMILSINGKKGEIYLEENNLFLMSHNSKWNDAEGLQPEKMHSWKCAKYLCTLFDADADIAEISLQMIQNYKESIEKAINAPLQEVKPYEVKFTRSNKEEMQQDQQEEMQQNQQEEMQQMQQEEMQQMKQEEKHQMKQEEMQMQQMMMQGMNQMQQNKMQMMQQMMQMMMQPAGLDEEALKQIASLKAQNEMQAKALDAALQRIEALENNAPSKVEYEFKTFNGTNKIEGLKHASFDKVMKVLNLGIPAYLYGPAGSGKNVMCEQIAKAFGLEFYYSNSVTQEYKITGHSDINGNLVETPFYKAFTEGGLFMLDEVDSSDPNALIVINAALANGYFDFPVVGKKMMHKNFRCIAAGNTKGTGATLQYSSRFIIDEATRDRFCFFFIDYDEKVEQGIIKQYDADDEILPFVYDIRKSAKKNQISVIAGYRLIKNLAKLTKAGLSVKDAISACFTEKFNEDDMSILAGDLVTYNNKFTEALKRLAA